MQDEKMGIAFYQHNIDTPEGVDLHGGNKIKLWLNAYNLIF
jgi:hypothetical protein